MNHPIREIEKQHMHGDIPAQITKETAENFCIEKRSLKINSKTLNEEITVYLFEGNFLYIPNPLKKHVKIKIVEDILTTSLYHPYRNSIDRALHVEEINLYDSFLKKQEIVSVRKVSNPIANVRIRQDPYQPKMESDVVEIDPLSLIKKIRWSSLGIYYDWEVKAYDRSIFHSFPELLEQASKEIAEVICKEKDFYPETAVINYYQKKDRIMSHIDRYEEDMSKPLISFSFGASCIFVLGRREKEDTRVNTFLLEDGDIAILFKESREFLHGVPKILDSNAGEALYKPFSYFPLISHSRINVSVRQAFKHPASNSH
ncbi:alkylated DNA repair protein alkB-like protein 1 [Nematocida sp. LUAm3]|nr:alkylated DNA repair protein alkB-like protein 1 [Nematocida sp. LUAm3]KAI5176400.1 alkylated DNA repair protein alkB-like protein 1 [Nematocida sp. LUAm2]KAI5179311.1 alkylated DNA repair protein alkB-like protein 1 [Nematocida sp. LUAm1]